MMDLKAERQTYTSDSIVKIYGTNSHDEIFEQSFGLADLFSELKKHFPNGFRSLDLTNFLMSKYPIDKHVIGISIGSFAGAHRFLDDLIHSGLVNRDRTNGNKFFYKIKSPEDRN